jgi:hypothetical protein
MSKQNTKPLVQKNTGKTAEKPRIFDENSYKNAVSRPNSGPLAHRSANELTVPQGERYAAPLSPEYTDLLAAPKSNFNFKTQFLPVAAILFFSLVLVLFYHLNATKSATGIGRGVAGDLNDLSNGRYEKQAADYSEEKVCTEHSDGTKTCTTKTKLHREFR